MTSAAVEQSLFSCLRLLPKDWASWDISYMLPDILCAETISLTYCFISAHFRGLSMKAAKALLYLTRSSMVPLTM